MWIFILTFLSHCLHFKSFTLIITIHILLFRCFLLGFTSSFYLSLCVTSFQIILFVLFHSFLRSLPVSLSLSHTHSRAARTLFFWCAHECTNTCACASTLLRNSNPILLSLYWFFSSDDTYILFEYFIYIIDQKFGITLQFNFTRS